MTASPWAGVPPAAPPLLRRDPSLWFILAALAITTLLHYLTDIHLIPYHSIYRSLYYLPIAVAAVRYGWRGGVLTALSASALYIPHVVMSWRVMPSDAFNDLLENVVFLFVGALVGTIADRERTQRRLAQASAAQLAQANAQLHTQAQAAQRMEAFIGSVVQSIGSGVLTLDQGGHVVLSNGAAHRLLGTATVPPNVEALPAPVQTYLASDAGYQQVQLGTRTVGLHRAPLLGARGDREGTVLVVDDLTELHALQEQVQRSQRLAALGRLAGGLAHEIRNPLGIVRAAAQLLQPQLVAQPQHAEYARVIQSEVDRVDRLIEQLLAYARPVPLSRGPVDLVRVVERAVALTRVVAAQSGVHLDARVEPAAPPVEGDSELLHQALINVLLNALQATSPGGRVCVEVVRDKADGGDGEAVALRVHDTGRGIAPHDQSRIFDLFYTTRDDGTGLGLSIVQQIAEAHGGSVTVTSALGQGTTMTVRLPLTAADGVAPPSAVGAAA